MWLHIFIITDPYSFINYCNIEYNYFPYFCPIDPFAHLPFCYFTSKNFPLQVSWKSTIRLGQWVDPCQLNSTSTNSTSRISSAHPLGGTSFQLFGTGSRTTRTSSTEILQRMRMMFTLLLPKLQISHWSCRRLETRNPWRTCWCGTWDVITIIRG